jgi:hypothetical protein
MLSNGKRCGWLIWLAVAFLGIKGSLLTLDTDFRRRLNRAMPRALRIEYPGAIYHVMNRGDHREPIFRDDFDHKRLKDSDCATPAAETAVTLKRIAAELHMGTWTHVANRLADNPTQSDHQPDLNLCQK